MKKRQIVSTCRQLKMIGLSEDRDSQPKEGGRK